MAEKIAEEGDVILLVENGEDVLCEDGWKREYC